MSDSFDAELVATEVVQRLATVGPADLVAVWEDGSVTIEAFNFWARKTANGGRETPLAWFLAGWGPPTREAILDSLVEGLVSRGWTRAS